VCSLGQRTSIGNRDVSLIGVLGFAVSERPVFLRYFYQDGRLVAMDDQGLGNSDYAYWLIGDSVSARKEVRVFRNWIIEEVRREAHAPDVRA
jgi:hypothetical protein